MKNQSESPYFQFIQGNKETQLKLHSFRHLNVGWRYGEGGPISASVVNLACQLNQLAWSVGIYETDAFPGIDGSISLEFYQDGDLYEFILRPDGTITFAHDRGDEEISYQDAIDIGEVKNLITERVSRLSWTSTYESFTKKNMLQKENDSTVVHSQEVTASQFFARNVSFNRDWISVSISENIMQTSVLPAIPPFSGSSPDNNFQRELCSSSKPLRAGMFATTT